MAKRGGHPPGMFTKSASSEEHPSQPSQAQLDHTEAMNKWFAESFNNLFMSNLPPILKSNVETLTKAENAKLNKLITHTTSELAHLHSEIAFLTEVIRKTMTADRYEKRSQEVRDEFDIDVKWKTSLYPTGDDDPKPGTKTTHNTPTAFKTIIKARTDDDDADKTEPLVTRDIPEPETKSWLRRLLNS